MILTTINGMTQGITGLAFQRGISQQREPLRMPGGIPVGGGRTIENEAGQSQGRGDVHGATVIANEELGSGHERNESGEVCRFFTPNLGTQALFDVRVLGDPHDWMMLNESVGECDIAIQGPALVVSTRSGMNENAAGRIHVELTEIRRRGPIWEGRNADLEVLKQRLGDLPVLRGDRIVQGDRDAMPDEPARDSICQLGTNDGSGTASACHDEGRIALIIRDQTGVRTQGPKDSANLQQRNRTSPGLIECAGLKGQGFDFRAGDAVERFCDGTGGDGDFCPWHGADERLNGGKKDDVIAELIHLKDEQLRGSAGVGIDHLKWEFIIPMQSIL